jgi:iron complex outermembrane recepter protein
MFNLSLNVRHAVRIAITGAAAAAAASTAVAQTAATTTTAAAPNLEEVIVTGTRIQGKPNDIAIAPVASITSTDIAQTGLVRTEDLLNNLPQVIAEESGGQSISSSGTASVSLRGLGSTRTLVLINGRRMQPGAGLGFASSADINQIPASMIERVDILTGGASSTYGADAVAGVVNFIMNTHFEGVKVNFDYGQNMYGQNNSFGQQALRAAGDPVPGNFVGGQNRNFSIAAGSNFADGKGNATAYATYLNTSPVAGYQLDYAGCTLNQSQSKGVWYTPVCGGSSTSATGRFLMYGLTKPGGTTTIVADHTVDKNSGQFRPFSHAGDAYNYGALSYVQREAERYTAGAFLNYDVNEQVNVYSETMFARNTSHANYGPSGAFAFVDATMSCSNPLFTASEQAVMCTPTAIQQNHNYYPQLTGNDILVKIARRSVESGPRIDNYSSNSIREVFGVKGSFSEAWTYDVYGQYGITQLQDQQGGFLGTPQIANALNVVPNPVNPGLPGQGLVAGVPIGGPVCESQVTGSDPTCVPWNIWNKGGVTPQQLNYLTVSSNYGVTSTEYVVDGSVTGDLGKYGWKIPSAANGIQANFGAEYRQESYVFIPDYIFENGFNSGGNGKFTPIDGQFHVNELFMEAKVPIADNLPGIYHLGFEGGYRYSKYATNNNTNTNTFKLGLEWAPIQDVRLRASFNRAVRAPNIEDLYAPAVIGAGGTNDICWGSSPAYTPAQCARTGLNPKYYGKVFINPAAQINTATGGNLNLEPEKADTYTVGFVVQPTMVPNLVVSLDYYDIKIDQFINTLSSTTILTNCAVNNNPTMCALIHRDPANGSLWFNNADFINTQELNSGSQTAKGFDLAAHYTMGLNAMGKLGLALTGTKVTDFSTQPLTTGPSYDCTGLYGGTCLSPTPKWRHVFQATWLTPWAGLELLGRWRYIGPVDADSTSSNPQLAQPFDPNFHHIGGYDYIDLSASISWGAHMDFRVGVNNVTDKTPPLVFNGTYSNCPTSTCNDNTWVGTYDTLGRYVFASVTAKF